MEKAAGVVGVVVEEKMRKAKRERMFGCCCYQIQRWSGQPIERLMMIIRQSSAGC